MNAIRGLRHSIFLHLAVLYLLLMAGLLAITVGMNRDGARNIEREIRDNVRNHIQFYINDVEQELDQIQDLESQYVIDRDLMLLSIDSESMTPYERLESIRGLQQRLAILEASSNYVEQAFIVIPSLDRIVVNDDFVTGIDERLYAALIDPIAGTSLAVNDGELYVAQAYPPGPGPHTGSLYVVAARLSRTHLESILGQVFGPHGGRATLRVDDGQWSLTSASPRDSMDGSMVLQFQEASSLFPIALEVGVSAADALGSLGEYRRWFRVAVAAAVLSICAFVVLSFRIVHRPLHRLVEAFHDLQAGKLDVTLSEHRGDEFDYLYASFNRMTGRLRELIRSVYEQEILRQRSELKRLQSQINPHFLYNNFFVLYRMIKASRLDDAATLTTYMGNYFRFVTRNGAGEDTLADEVAHARTYSDIQSLSFGHRIVVDFPDPPEEIRDAVIPRLVLQPILENAYEHALERRSAGAQLTVSYRLGSNWFEVLVEDNGKGLTDVDIQSLNASLVSAEQLSSSPDVLETGMLNVHRRIVLRYGSGGVSLQRGSAGGLLVTLRIPGSTSRTIGYHETSGS